VALGGVHAVGGGIRYSVGGGCSQLEQGCQLKWGCECQLEPGGYVVSVGGCVMSVGAVSWRGVCCWLIGGVCAVT
jgi:hypothetical protein